MSKTVFVTVGTTRFDALLAVIDEQSFQKALLKHSGAVKLVVQCGKSEFRPQSRQDEVTIESYSFRPDLNSDMTTADLIITHCGAGTILEVLRLHKRAIAVINDELLDNHQIELADAMENDNYMIIARRPEDLPSVLSSRRWEETRLYPDPDPSLFLNELSTLVQLG